MAIDGRKRLAAIDIKETPNLLIEANEILAKGLKPKDALHIASALIGEADYFITTDDGILKKTNRFQSIQILNPTDFIKILEP